MARKRRKNAKIYGSQRIIIDKMDEISYSQRFKIQRKIRRNRMIFGISVILFTGVGAMAFCKANGYDLYGKLKESNPIKLLQDGLLAVEAKQGEPDINQVNGDESATIETTFSNKAIEFAAMAAAADSLKESNVQVKDEEKKVGKFESQVVKSNKVKADYFSDAVFLGDSRTEGLIINTGLSEATFYGGKGLMVDSVFTEKIVKLPGSKAKVTPIKALGKKEFNKVYIMFGVNELGWPYEDVFSERYTKLIKKVKKLQPDADIYVQSILPVSKEKETKDKVYNNKKIRRFNKLIKDMAEKEEVYYLDTASAVKNKDNVLPVAASSDGVHLNKEYCIKWLDYLKTHTVRD